MSNDIEYFIFEEDGVVVCKIWGNSQIALNKIRKHVPWSFVRHIEYYFIKEVYIGEARCHPEDEFDIEYGKKLARDRAKRKREKDVNRMIKKYLKDVRRQLDEIERCEVRKE